MNTIRNAVQLIGNVIDKPAISKDQKTSTFRIATVESYTNPEGKKISDVNYFDCHCSNGLTNIVRQYISKGARIAISGKLISNSKDNSVFVNVADILLLNSKRRTNAGD